MSGDKASQYGQPVDKKKLHHLMNTFNAYLDNDEVKFSIYCPNCYRDMPYDTSIKQFWDIFPEYKNDPRYYQHNHWLYCINCVDDISNLVRAENE